MITTDLTFMSGSPLGTTRNTTIVIRDDSRPEGAETFMVNLVSSVSQVTLGNPSSATVVILGDDGKCSAEVWFLNCFTVVSLVVSHDISEWLRFKNEFSSNMI